MQTGLVSVIIPTYNRSQAVERAIESVLSQDYPQIEVIVVDDGSKDDTVVRLRKYEGNPRVRCIFKANGGVASARNRGIEEAQGEFIAMLDSDDWFLPGKISLQVACMNLLPDAGLIWSDMDAVNNQGEVVKPRFLRKMYGAYRFYPTPQDLFERELEGPGGVKLFFGNIFSPIILGNIVHTSTLMARAERIQKSGMYDPKRFPPRKPGEDHDFHLRMAAVGPVAFVDAVTINYVVGAGDAITNPENNRFIALSYLEHLEHSIATYGDRIQLPKKQLADTLINAITWVGQAHYYKGMLPQARKYLARSLVKRPLSADGWKYFAASLVPMPVRETLRQTFRKSV